MRLPELTLGVAAGLLLTAAADAATIRVAQDGSGHYTVLFEGIAAAKPGDVVSVGPGKYTDTRMVSPPGGGEYPALGMIASPDVQVIGDDRESVFVGPEVPPADVRNDGAWGLGVLPGVTGVTIKGITFRNLSRGTFESDMAISLEDCRFIGCYYGALFTGYGPARVLACDFFDNRYGIDIWQPRTRRDFAILACKFVDNVTSIDNANVVTKIQDCTITGGFTGVWNYLAGQSVIERCVITDTAGYGVQFNGRSIVWLFDCEFRGVMHGSVGLIQGGTLYGSGNSLEAGVYATLVLRTSDPVVFTGNRILKCGGPSVSAYYDPRYPSTADLRNNEWGTTDVEQIEAWIDHAGDDPANNGLAVDYLPFVGQPVPVSASSVGRLKGSFAEQ